nr:zinc finger, CCHC-type [Tanacetum cinerariifolium]
MVSCYTDAGYLTDADDLKTQTGYVFVLNGGDVDWKSAKQSIFATSFAEAEHIAAFDASKEAVWVRKFISWLGVVPIIEEPISMYCDNTRAIAIANESGITKGARHFRTLDLVDKEEKLVMRGFFEKQKLTGPKFIDWYRRLKIVLSSEDKLNYLEQPIPPAPVAPAEPLHAHEMVKELKTLFAQQVEQELLRTTRDFHSCRQEEGQLVSSYVLKMKGYIDNLERLGHPVTLGLGHKKSQTQTAAKGQNHRKGKNKQAYAFKPKIPPPPKKENPVKDFICHECREIGHWKRNCPQNNVVYFSAIPRDGIFEIDLSNSLTNESSIYAVSDKRAKLDLDSALLWHCRLRHISKKRIEKLQHDGLLNSSDLTAFENVSLDHGIIAHRTPPYTSQHNGVSERRNRTLLDMVRSMMSQTTLPKSFWDYALETAARILNMVPTKKFEKTPYEVWHGKAPKLSYLKV